MNIVFVSIPRTGTQSLHEALGTGRKNNHYGITAIPEKGFSFAIFRSPLERLKSWFIWHKEMYVNHKVYDMSMYQTDFKSWVRNGCPHHWTNVNMLGITNPLHQHQFVTDESGIIQVDYIGLYEKFSESLNHVSKRTGFKFNNVPHIGNSNRAKVSHDDDTHLRIREMFQKDYILYHKILSRLPEPFEAKGLQI